MIEQGTPEWFEQRRGKLTASRMTDAQAGKTTAARLNYQAQLIAERLTGEVGESFSNAAMQWGTDNEPLARAEYEILRGVDVNQISFVDHPSISWCGASPDGLVNDDGLIEIKCPNTATHIGYILENVPPTKYKPQMLLQLACTERTWCDFVSFDPRMPEGLRLFVVRFEPSRSEIEAIEKNARDFLGDVSTTIVKLTEWRQQNGF